jgi:hypothetical protein
LLKPLAADSVIVREETGRKRAVADLLDVDGPDSPLRIHRTMTRLRKIINVVEDKNIAAVHVEVTTRWPSVSYELTQWLVRAVDRFNVQTRKSQASAERHFADSIASAAERALRSAEDRLQLHIQQNRVIASSPEVAFERDRLQRDVAVRQQIYLALAQSAEQAKINEVRDTPVITLLDRPQLPIVPEPRRAILKTLVAGVLGVLIGAALGFVIDRLRDARRAGTEEANEFARLAASILSWRPFKRIRSTGIG